MEEIFDKIRSIRVSGINNENKQEALIYFKYIIKSNLSGSVHHDLIDELVIYGYYFNFVEETFSIIDKLELSDHIKYNNDQMLSNKKFYIPQLKIKSKHQITPNCEKNFVPMNSSIIKMKDSYLMLCRTVNYRLYENGKYDIIDNNRIQKSHSMIIELDKNLSIKSQFRVSDNSDYIKYDHNIIKGLEDGILFNMKDELYMSCTALDTNIEGKPQINVCKFDNNYNISDKIIYISPYNRAEKNWLPVITNNELKFIYSFNPISIIEGPGTIKTIPSKHKLNVSNFKGSAAPIPFGDNYLCIIHQTTHKIKKLYIPLYTHRFILLDKNFNILKMSKQFYFEKFGIEFCRSMCYSFDENNIIITYSVNDASSNFCIISINTIKDMLTDVDNFELSIEDFNFIGDINYGDLMLVYKKVNELRGYPNKTTFYIKFFFKLLGINFPGDKISLDKFDQKTINLIFMMIDEIIILGYYINYSDIALILSERMIFSNSCNINKNQAIFNQRYYIKKLEYITNKKINIKYKDYNSMNPSILKTNDGYIINCRLVNYELYSNGLYHIKNESGRIITENIIIKYDKEFNIMSEHMIVDKSGRTKISNPNIQGYEDLILFEHNNRLKFSCTTLDTNIYRRPQISLCELNDDYDIIDVIPLDSPQNKMEKNWLPIVINDNIHFIYEYNPFTINSLNKNLITNPNNLNFSRFKGSAAPVSFDDGYLIIVHETFNLNNTLRCYLHRFLYLSKSFEIQKLSHPFFFEHHGIEFCRSMCHSHDDTIILSYSIHDKNSQLCEISKQYIRELLKDLNYFII